MADLEKSTAAAPARDAEGESFATLFGRLSDGVTTLLDTKLSLLKIEIKEDVNAYIRGSVMILAGAIIAAVGFAIVNVAIAVFVSWLLPSSLDLGVRLALGFAITGAVYLLVGVVFIITAKNRMAKQGIVPERSINELKKDKELLERIKNG